MWTLQRYCIVISGDERLASSITDWGRNWASQGYVRSKSHTWLHRRVPKDGGRRALWQAVNCMSTRRWGSNHWPFYVWYRAMQHRSEMGYTLYGRQPKSTGRYTIPELVVYDNNWISISASAVVDDYNGQQLKIYNCCWCHSSSWGRRIRFSWRWLNRFCSNFKIFHFAINPESILLKIAPYNNHIKLKEKTQFWNFDPKVKSQNQRWTISFCDKSWTA